jgi:acetyl-CoA C-acetyltransferase
MLPRDPVVLAAVRTPIGRFGGSLKDLHPAELGAVAVRAAIERAGVDPVDVGEVVVGHARQAGSGPNPARQVVRRAGLPDAVPAQTINKACASGLQAIASAAQAIALGETTLTVAGGIEAMSRMPFLLDARDARWGKRLGHVTLADAMYRDGFECPLADMIMGETAEVLARHYRITREASDAFALTSQVKAMAAVAGGRFLDEIAPVTITVRGDDLTCEADEHPRPETTLASLARLPAVFGDVEGQPGIITAGSASGITDGGAAAVIASAERAAATGRTPLARILGWASAGVDPRMMGIGPVPAVRTLLARLDMRLDDFGLIELNEAFAPQVIACVHDLGIDAARLNVNGGAIALGHPIGCTGTRIVVTLLHEMRRRRVRYGLATLCVSGGMGMAMAFENLA